jgi:hypothetical protein
MQIDIINAFTNDGKQYYKWDLWDGPDGIEHVHGFATDLIQCFSKILEWHERIGADYAAEIEADVNISNNLPQSNETN